MVVLESIAGGDSDNNAAKSVGISQKTVRRYRDSNRRFATAYECAVAVRALRRTHQPIPDDLTATLESELERLRGIEGERDTVPPPMTPPPVREVIIPEVMAMERVGPVVGGQSAPRGDQDFDEHIRYVEDRVPTGSLGAGSTWDGGFEPMIAKAQSTVDDPDAPPGLRAAAWRTLEKIYIDPVMARMMWRMTQPVAHADPAEDAPTEKPKREPGLSKDVVDMVTNAIAGPPVEA